MTNDSRSQRLKYRSHSSITTDVIVFTGYDFYSLGGPIKSVAIDLSGLDTHDAYDMARALQKWCERVIVECAEEWAAESQLAMFEGP